MASRDESTRRADFCEDGDGRRREAVRDGSTDNPIITSRKYTAEEIAKATKKLKRARLWRARNPRAYATIERLAMDEAERGRKFGGKYLAEVARQRGIVKDEDGEYFRLGNDYTAIFARWLKSEHPDMAGMVRTKPCALDKIM